MAAKRDPIHELEKKVSGLVELTGKASLQGFCDAAGVSREGLRARLNDCGTQGLNGDYQKALAGFAGFSLDWPEWIETDPARRHNGQRRDTAEAFLDRCCKESARFDQAEVDGASLRAAIDWKSHRRNWVKAGQPVRSDHLPVGAAFQDAPFAPEMMVVPPGRYWMGSDSGEGDEDRHPRRPHDMPAGSGGQYGPRAIRAARD